jgi:tetratricopeptide (TPR) repeat protein
MPRRPVLLAALAAAAIAFLVHVGTLSAGFVHDDHRFVERNPALDSIDLSAFFGDPASASAPDGVEPDIYRPIRTLDFAVDRALFGRERAWGWHLGNLLWHALNAVLAFRILLPIARRRVLPALAGALLFAVHPVTSEAVAWISSRGDLLAVSFLLLALWALEREGTGRTVAGGLCCLLACFSKESAVVLPALLPLRDLALPAEVRPALGVTGRRALILLLLVGGYFLARSSVVPVFAQLTDAQVGDWLSRSRTMSAGVAWYAGALAWPAGFRFDHMVVIPDSWGDPSVVLGLGVLASLLLLVAHAARRRSYPVLFATLGALVLLAPVSNIVVPLKAFVAERFLYPVLLAVAAGVAWALFLPRPGRARVASLLAAAAGLVALGAVTIDRNRAWASDESLWEAVRRDRPEHPRSYEGLGFASLEAGRTERAERFYRAYLEHNPDDGKSWMLLGDLFGDVARSLRLPDEPGVETDIDAKRFQARAAQLSAYRAALAAFDRVGLVRGRGSRPMLESIHRKRRDAAWDMGDPREAADANDALIAIEGLDPARPEEVLARGSRSVRGARWALALEMLLSDPGSRPPEEYRRRTEDRARLLRDLGIDPMTPDPAALGLVEPGFSAFAREDPADRVTRRNLVALLMALGRTEEAAEVARALVAEER